MYSVSPVDKINPILSVELGRPLLEPSIIPVGALKVGGTTPTFESLGSKARAPYRAYVEVNGISETIRGSVPEGARNFVQHRHYLFGKITMDHVETPCDCLQVVLKLQRVLQKSGQVG